MIDERREVWSARMINKAGSSEPLTLKSDHVRGGGVMSVQTKE